MRIFAIGFLFLLSACATNRPIELTAEQKEKWIFETQKLLSYKKKLASVSTKILTHGKNYCEKYNHIGPYVGIDVISNQIFETQWHELALSEFGIGNEVQIIFVASNSPADSAGLKINDIIREINGQPIQNINQLEKIKKNTTNDGKSIILSILRGKEYLYPSISPSISCKSQAILVDLSLPTVTFEKPDLNIVISKGLMENLESDEEIAMAVSHQLAHNVRRHWGKNDIYGYMTGAGLGLLGLTFDVALKLISGRSGLPYFGDSHVVDFWKAGRNWGNSITNDQELEADHDSFYLMNIAGYDLKNAIKFSTKHFEKKDRSDTYFHPFIESRPTKIETSINQIKENSETIIP